MSLLAPANEKPLTEENVATIKDDIATLVNQKQVIKEEQNALLRSTLGAYFLNNDMQEVYLARLEGKDGTAQIQTKIRQIYKAFGLAYTDGSLSSSISNLSQSLQN